MLLKFVENDNELGEEKSISLKLEFNFGYF